MSLVLKLGRQGPSFSPVDFAAYELNLHHRTISKNIGLSTCCLYDIIFCTSIILKVGNIVTTPRVLILHANGTNRDIELSFAFELAGAQAEIVHLNQLRAKERHWHDYQILAIPGGFSYADTLGAGRLFAIDLLNYFTDEVNAFVAKGKPTIGICNGFQVLIKTGILPNLDNKQTEATLTFNSHGQFECRWVTLLPQSKHCLWTSNLAEPIYCPIAHGEGNLQFSEINLLNRLQTNDQIALSYVNTDGSVDDMFPHNPNGSIANIAGLCSSQGNVLGLMPHPEDHILPYQHPRWTRGEHGRLGLPLFKNGVDYCK